MSDIDWMAQALQFAKRAAHHNEVPVGAVVVYQDRRIGEGWNQPIGRHDPSAHAEIIAMRHAANTINNYRLLNTTLYVTLEPCTMCIGAMVHARIQRLVFGAVDPKTGVVCSVDSLLESTYFNHKINWQGGVAAQACSQLLKTFFKNKRSS